jgi:hypothetical protein
MDILNGHQVPKGLHFQAVHPEVQSMEQVAAMKAAIEGGLGALGADDQLMWRWRNGHGLPMGLRFFDSH